MNRKAEIFFDAVTHLREDLVEEAQNYAFRKQGAGWRKFASLAACVALVVSIGMLAVLPKGCGSSGGSSNDTAAPAEMPDFEGVPSGDGKPEESGNMAPEPSDEVPSSEEERFEFTARVLEVLEDGLLVEPAEGLPADVGRVRVSTAGLEGLPEFHTGDTVTVTCSAVSREEGEAAAEGVTAVWLTEPDTP